jgi:chromate transport protein ChrA
MNDKWNLFQKFLITQEQQISITDFLLNAAVVVVLAIILEFTYIKCAKTISNRKQFAGTFLLLAFTTMLIITIVKTSLALSLGLVGALSIVRFRAAIKEPEELTYLFFAIAIGLGLGANQTMIIITAFAVGMLILWGRFLIGGRSKSQNLYLNVNAAAGKVNLDDITEIIKTSFGKFHIKRYDENDNAIEASFLIDSPNTKALANFKKKSEQLSKGISVSFVESKSF